MAVVVPVFNGGRFIGRTIEFALAQTYNDIDVIIVDDGSTDRTPIIVKAVAAKDPRVRYFRTDNFGPAAARNFGIAQARGDLIALLDHDDLWHRDKIARQVELMQASPAKVGWSIAGRLRLTIMILLFRRWKAFRRNGPRRPRHGGLGERLFH